MITLPAIPEPPPVDPPNPADDPHAYNVWLARWANYKWLVNQHTRREMVQAIETAVADLADKAADYFDAIDKAADRKDRRAMVFEAARTFFPVRTGDTDTTYARNVQQWSDRLIAAADGQ